MSAFNLFPKFFQDKAAGAAPYDASALAPAAGTPSIYQGEEEWAAFRELQDLLARSAAERAIPSAGAEAQAVYERLTNPATPIGNPTRGPSFAEMPAQAPIDGSGVVGPTADILNALSASFTAAKAPTNAPAALLKSDGSRDIYGVNAAEGGNRVNKNTAEFGVKATQGADGKVTLTNVGVP